MESGGGRCISAPGPRGVGGKKMRKRKELDALVGGAATSMKRGGMNKRRTLPDQLLTDSTEEEDYWPTSNSKPTSTSKGRCHSSKGRMAGCRKAVLRLCGGLILGACAITTITVIWLFIDIREQTAFLRSQLDQVAAGSQGVPDAFQKCHSMSRQLQTNQTMIFTQMAQVAKSLDNITSQIGLVQGGLAQVKDKLTSTPDLINVPHDVLELSASVATFGSQMQDIQSSFQHLEEEQKIVLTFLEELKINLTSVNTTIHYFVTKFNPEISAVEEDSNKYDSLINKLNETISTLNDSISLKFKWIESDERKDHASIEDLKEMSVNFSSRLSTLQNDCSSKRITLEVLSTSINNLTYEYTQQNKRLKELTESIYVLSRRIALTENSSFSLMYEISDMKKHLSNHVSGVAVIPFTSETSPGKVAPVDLMTESSVTEK